MRELWSVEHKHRIWRIFTVLRMLTPRRAEVGPEEIGDGPGDKGTSSATSGSVTPGGSYENGDNSKEFLSTGRTGRRNALPNILGRHAETGLSDLSDRFEELSTHTGINYILLSFMASNRGIVNNKKQTKKIFFALSCVWLGHALSTDLLHKKNNLKIILFNHQNNYVRNSNKYDDQYRKIVWHFSNQFEYFK